MTLSNYLDNISIVDIIQLYWQYTTLYLGNLFSYLKDFQNKTFSEITTKDIYFDEFQWGLLKIFSSILIINLILITIVWKIYGKSICERFMRHSTLKEIEELKASVSKLKLPKEYSPRI